MGTHFFDSYQALTQYADASVLVRASAALDQAFDQHTHTFVIGLLTLMLAIQLISLGILAMQSKHYFEEIYHLGSSIRQSQRPRTSHYHD